jgi:hypothetical protein
MSMMWTEKSWKKIHEDGGEVVEKLVALVIVRRATRGNVDGGKGVRERPAKGATKGTLTKRMI